MIWTMPHLRQVAETAPFALLELGIAKRDAAQRGEDQADCELGHRHRVAACRARNLDTALARSCEVEIVDADAPFM